MKLLIATAVLLSSSLGFAAAKCGADETTVKTCKSTPVGGDGVVVPFKTVAICATPSTSKMYVEANGKSEGTEAKKTERVGGVSYTVDADGTVFSLSFPTGTRPGQPVKAKLTVSFAGGESTSSTFTCN